MLHLVGYILEHSYDARTHERYINGVTNTRCCRYSCLRSWWWVMVPTKTCRAVSRSNKLCNVASCWIYVRTFLRCTDPWTLYSKRGQCNFKSYVWEILVNRNSSTYPPDVSFKVLLIYVNEMQPVKGSVFKAVNPPKATSHSALVTKDSVPTSVLVVKNCAVLVKFTRPKKKWISAVLSAYYSPLFGKNYQQRPWHYRTKLTEINTHGKQSVFHRPISWCSWR